MPIPLSRPATRTEAIPMAQAARRVAWSFSVPACDVFVLCRVLLLCDEVDIRRCAPVIRQREARIRVDITLPAAAVDTALHHVLQHLGAAEIGRIQ